MRFIIEYLRSCFCKHDFIYAEQWYEEKSDWGTKESIRVSRTCTKCGYHKSYWKF